jgi:hypothetical protein
MYVVQVYEDGKWMDTHPVYPAKSDAEKRKASIVKNLGKKTRIIKCVRTLEE